MTNLPVSGEFAVTAIFGQKGTHWANGHKGIDIVSNNRAIYSTCDGIVRVVAFDEGGWGQYVTIGDHDGNVHIFCHLVKDSVLVRTGDRVTRVNKIATMGNTGNSTGTHLHYQINNQYGNPIDPTPYLKIPNKAGRYNSEDFTIDKGNDDMYDNKPDEYAEIAVKKAFDKKIIKGDEDGDLMLHAPVTRQDLMVFFDRLGLLD